MKSLSRLVVNWNRVESLPERFTDPRIVTYRLTPSFSGHSKTQHIQPTSLGLLTASRNRVRRDGRPRAVFRRSKSLHERQANAWPDELSTDSTNVPTYHLIDRGLSTATRQLDFAFASKGMADSVRLRTLKDLGNWEPSDHSRIKVEFS